MGGFLKRMVTGPSRPDQVSVEVQDRMIIKHLGLQGAQLDQPREIRHYLRFTTEAGTLAVIQVLDRDDRFVHARIDPQHGNSEVTITHTDVLTMDLLRELRREFQHAATAFGGEYDGWEAAATP